MRIVNKMFLTFSLTFVVFALITLHITNTTFSSVLTEQVTLEHARAADEQKQMILGITSTLDNISIHFTSDRYFGEMLNKTVFANELDRINTKNEFWTSVASFFELEIPVEDIDFDLVLLLNPEIKLSDLYSKGEVEESYTTYEVVFAGDNFYENEQLMESLYKRNRISFIDENTNKLCILQKMQHTYYSGEYPDNGVALLLMTLDIEHFTSILSRQNISENTFFVLSQDGRELLKSENAPDLSLAQLTDEQYIINNNSLIDFDITFVTPRDDISRAVGGLITPYLQFFVLGLVLLLVASYFVSRYLAKPIIALTGHIELIQSVYPLNQKKVAINHASLEVTKLLDSFNAMLSRIDTLIADLRENDEKKRTAELCALQAQINPHFILNAMNTVNWIALSREQDDIANIVNSIASLMRYSITEPDRTIPITSEIENINHYIEMYELRFNRKTQIELSCACDITNVFIPKFTLQPLIENSIVHSNTKSNEDVCIKIDIGCSETEVVIEVVDNGVGGEADKMNDYISYIETDLKVAHGFGIRNVNERLKLKFGNESYLRYYINDDSQLVAKVYIKR